MTVAVRPLAFRYIARRATSIVNVDASAPSPSLWREDDGEDGAVDVDLKILAERPSVVKGAPPKILKWSGEVTLMSEDGQLTFGDADWSWGDGRSEVPALFGLDLSVIESEVVDAL
jgi:hypothetical protein